MLSGGERCQLKFTQCDPRRPRGGETNEECDRHGRTVSAGRVRVFIRNIGGEAAYILPEKHYKNI